MVIKIIIGIAVIITVFMISSYLTAPIMEEPKEDDFIKYENEEQINDKQSR